MNNSKFIDFDYYLNDSLFQFEVESKGVLFDVKIEFSNGKQYEIVFYDLFRFQQDATDELKGKIFFYEKNVVFLQKLTLDNIMSAKNSIEDKKIYLQMISD